MPAIAIIEGIMQVACLAISHNWEYSRNILFFLPVATGLFLIWSIRPPILRLSFTRMMKNAQIYLLTQLAMRIARSLSFTMSLLDRFGCFGCK